MPFFHLKKVWSPEELSALRDFMKNGTFKTMPRNTAKREREVRLAPNSKGECPFEYLVKVKVKFKKVITALLHPVMYQLG